MFDLNNLESLKQLITAQELFYVGLMFSLFVFPRIFIRFGIPYALTAFALGVSFNFANISFAGDRTIQLLATLGIVALFLFAGIEVDFKELKKLQKSLAQHVVVKVVSIALATALLQYVFSLDLKVAAIMALALLTPSTGFILDSLEHSKVAEISKHWIKSKAIATEIVALLIMFILTSSSSLNQFTISFLIMTLLIFALPKILGIVIRIISPYAPNSEFGFLLMIALVASIITKKLGAYYLVGAFIVGLIARSYKREVPGLTTNILNSYREFTSIFIPFYFFYAGNKIEIDVFSLQSLMYGFVFLLLFTPFRILAIVVQRKRDLKEDIHTSLPIAISLLPNLVFGLVLVSILVDSFGITKSLQGGLIIYTVVVTLIPSFLLKWTQKLPETDLITTSEQKIGGSDMKFDKDIT